MQVQWLAAIRACWNWPATISNPSSGSDATSCVEESKRWRDRIKRLLRPVFFFFFCRICHYPTFHKNPMKPYNAVQKTQVSLQLGNIFMTCWAHSADWLPFCEVNQTRSTDVRDGRCNHGSELANTCAPEVEPDESNEIVIVLYICLLQNEALNKFLRHSMCWWISTWWDSHFLSEDLQSQRHHQKWSSWVWHIEERKGNIDVEPECFNEWIIQGACSLAFDCEAFPCAGAASQRHPTSILDYVSLDSQSPTLQPSHVPQIQSLSTDATCFVPGSHYPSMSEWLTSWNHRFQSSLNLNDLNLAKVILMQRLNH